MEAFVPTQQRGNFIMTPQFILETKTLAQGAKTVFAVLASFARSRSYCYPSQDTIANKAGASKNSIRAWLNQLVEHGFLKIAKNENGKNVYHLFCPKDKDKQENQSQEAIANFDSPIAKFAPEVNNINKINQIPPYNNTSLSSAIKNTNLRDGGGEIVNFSFENFWNVYPRKENKEKARISFYKQLNTNNLPKFSIFQKAIDFFKDTAQWQREHGRFIPQLHNFIFDKRWEDWTEEYQKADKCKQPTAPPKLESLEERRKRNIEFEQEKEKEIERAKKLDEAWGKFQSYFIHDSSLNRFLAKCIFIEKFNKGWFLEVKTKPAVSVYEYFKQHNLIKARK